MGEPIDIGSGVSIYYAHHEGRVVGLLEEHIDPKGEKCSGYVRFRQPPNDPATEPSWKVDQQEPLTLSPSILCRTCGHHGWIRDGRWIPA